ncbi:hypothetical protein ACFYXJ_03850 [Streptomyces sp. NPDC002667]|uniref:hypothetical protein n=1 Tax=Streptomyces sp. NPDC002667 TaxID=3364657 RepID=UPI003683D08C
MTDEARHCASCGRPTAAPAPAPSPATPPLPSSPPAVPGTAQAPAAASAALTRLLKGDWIGPARIAALPTALLLLLSLALASTTEDVPFGSAVPTALAVVLSALGGHPGLNLAERGSTPLASLELSFMPLGVTLLWAVALWFGARLYLRGAAAAGRHLDTAEALLLGVRGVLSAVLGSLLLAWAAGTSVDLPPSDSSDASAAYLMRFLDLPDVTLSVTNSPLRAAWWTLVLASVVLLPTLCRTATAVWTARRPVLGDWLRAARGAAIALAVPLALGGLFSVVFLVSEDDFSVLVPAVLLAPNLAATLLGLGSGASVDFADTLVLTDSSSSSSSLSLFALHDLSGWIWLSVLLAVVAAVVLGAGVLREAERPAAALRAIVCFVAGFLLLALMAGVSVELSSEVDDSSFLAAAFGELNISSANGGTLSLGLGVPTVLLSAAVWAALGAFGVPAVADRLGITRLDVAALSALRERLNGRSGHAPAAMTTVPAPVPVPVAAAVAAAPAGAVEQVAHEAVPAPPKSAPAQAPAQPSTTEEPTEQTERTEPTAPSEPSDSVDEPAEPEAEPAQPADEPTTPTNQPTAPTAPEDVPADPSDAADEPTDTGTEPTQPAEATEASVEPTPTTVDVPIDAPAASPAEARDHPAEVAAPQPVAPPAQAPAASGLLETPGGAGPHAAAFANLPTGSMAYPAAGQQAVHAPVPRIPHAPAPQPGRRRIGWGVVAVTLVTSAVLAGGLTAAGIWLTSDRSASPAHTTRATGDAVPSAAGAPSSSSAPAPVDPSAPSGSDVSPSASQLSPEDIARQVDGLLEENAPQLGRVGNAITAGSSCSHGAKPVEDAREELLEVAVKRDDLARRVDLLAPQADGDLAEALGDLSTAWTASAKADRGYASWVSQTVDYINEFGITGCGHSETRNLGDLPTTHDAEATAAKRHFAALWNPIARQYGLTEREPGSI